MVSLLKKCGLIVVLFLGLQGCVTEGREFSSDCTWIKKGVTTQDNVRMVLGDPQRVGNSDGQATWTYGFYKYRLIGTSTTKELKVYWRPDRTVDSFTFNSSFPGDISVSRAKDAARPQTRD
jgi:outer membrane protein assembly factor BamE (lipoprotein component of BamABCDE complex)